MPSTFGAKLTLTGGGEHLRRVESVHSKIFDSPSSLHANGTGCDFILEPVSARGRSGLRLIFQRQNRSPNHMNTRQYARIVHEWITAINLRRAEYGTQSLRRTKAAMIYRGTGNIRAI